MTNKAVEILQRIYISKTADQICEELNISRKKLMYYLKLMRNEGHIFMQEYLSNGDIVLKNKYPNDFSFYINNIPKIIPSYGVKQIHAIGISDLNIGSINQRIDLLNIIYDYCKKNDIHLIFCTGDLISGIQAHNQLIPNVINQTKSFIENYPYDPHITTFAVLGDNDFSSIYSYRFDPKIKIEKERHDIKVCGYNYAKIFIANTPITLHHFMKDEKPILNTPIVLSGHTKMFNIKRDYDENQVFVKLPALSNSKKTMPSAVELIFNVEIKPNNTYGDVKFIDMYQLVPFENELYPMNSLSFQVAKNEQQNNEKQKIITK